MIAVLEFFLCHVFALRVSCLLEIAKFLQVRYFLQYSKELINKITANKMKQDQFLEKLLEADFPAPELVELDVGKFLDMHSYPYEIQALVLEGQIDITIGGIKTTFLPGDTFRLLPNQVHTINYGAKGVKYLASKKPFIAQDNFQPN